MRLKFLLASMILLLASINCMGQIALTSRRNLQTKQDQGAKKARPVIPGATPLTNEAVTYAPVPTRLQVSTTAIKLKIVGQIALIRVEQRFRNDTDHELEGTCYFPVPEGAIFVEFAVYDGAERRVGRQQEKDEERQAYTFATGKSQDPAILEMIERGWLQAHIHRIPAHSDKGVEITYSQNLIPEGNITSFDYALKTGNKRVKVSAAALDLELDISAFSKIENVVSTTHPMEFTFDGERHVTGKLKAKGGPEDGNFRLQYSVAAPDLAISHPTHSEGGKRSEVLTMDLPGSTTLAVSVPELQTAQVQTGTLQPVQVAATGVELSAGRIADSVSVVSVASSFDSSTSQISTNLDPKRVKDLPMLEPFERFILLAPGVKTASNGLNRPQTGLSHEFDSRFFINGGRALSTTHLLGRVDNNGLDGQQTILVNNPDAVESLALVTTRGSGDVVATGASSINLQSRSGSNFYHGSIFDYYLNRNLGALSPLERRSGLSDQPKYKDSLYGFTLGGPIRRDRYFFFGSFQGETERAQRFFDSTAAYQTPTPAGLEMLSRHFGNSKAVADLLARSPLVQTIAPAQVNRIFVRQIQGIPIEFGEVTRLLPTSLRGYEANSRFDANLSLRDNLEAQYWFNQRNATNSIGRLAAGFTGDLTSNAHLGLVRWTRNLSPISINDASFSYNRSSVLPSPETKPANPIASVATGLFGLAYGNHPLLSSGYNSSVFEFADSFTRSAGRHNVKAGGQIKRRLTSFAELNGTTGQYNFLNFDDFVQDRPFTLSLAAGQMRTAFTQTLQHYFLDEAWRMKSNLTLVFGLSYETYTQPINSLAEKIRRRESSPATALFDTSLPLASRTIMKVDGDNNNLLPRLGFAYTPRFQLFGLNPFGFDKTVIRGGASVSYDRTAYRPLLDVARSSPNIMLAVIKPAANISLPRFPDLPDAATLGTLALGEAKQFSRAELAKDFRSPYSINWHLSARRDFDSRIIWDLHYAGSRGVGLAQLLDESAAQSEIAGDNFIPVTRLYTSTGRSSYHAIQTSMDVRVIDTLTAGISYTLSKLTDDVPDYSLTNVGGINQLPAFYSQPSFAQNPQDLAGGEHAVSGLDRRHSLTGHFLWTLPRLRGRSGFWAKMTEGWQLSSIFELASGSPYTALQYFGQSLNSAAGFSAMFAQGFGNVRPFTGNAAAAIDSVAFSNAANQYYRFFWNADGTPYQSATGFIIANRTGFHAGELSEARFVYNDYAVEQAARRLGLSPEAFGQTFAQGRRFGSERRNSLLSPDLANVDMALIKTTKLSEKVSLQFRAEAFNLFNHPNRLRPNFLVENAGGRGFADSGEVDASPRRIRLALKLIF